MIPKVKQEAGRGSLKQMNNQIGNAQVQQIRRMSQVGSPAVLNSQPIMNYGAPRPRLETEERPGPEDSPKTAYQRPSTTSPSTIVKILSGLFGSTKADEPFIGSALNLEFYDP